MILIRCLSCHKVLGEFEGKWRVKCKMAGCGDYNLGNTLTGAHVIEESPMKIPYSMREDVACVITSDGETISLEESKNRTDKIISGIWKDEALQTMSNVESIKGNRIDAYKVGRAIEDIHLGDVVELYHDKGYGRVRKARN